MQLGSISGDCHACMMELYVGSKWLWPCCMVSMLPLGALVTALAQPCLQLLCTPNPQNITCKFQPCDGPKRGFPHAGVASDVRKGTRHDECWLQAVCKCCLAASCVCTSSLAVQATRFWNSLSSTGPSTVSTASLPNHNTTFLGTGHRVAPLP